MIQCRKCQSRIDEMETPITQNKERIEVIYDFEFLIENHKVYNPISMPNHHLHDVFELYYLKKGARFYFIKDKTYYIQQGDLILISPYEFHGTMNINNYGYERVLIHFRKNYLAKILSVFSDVDIDQPFRNGYRIIRFSPLEQSKVEILLSSMLNEFETENPHKDIHLKLMLVQLFLLILRCPNRLKESTIAKISPHHQTILDALSYIANHYHEDLTLAFVAKKFCFSPWYFSRIFKQATGMLYTEYLNKIRINEAQKLLLKTHKPITEIAGTVGFNSLTNFGRVFKQIAGCSPRQYKNKHK